MQINKPNMLLSEILMKYKKDSPTNKQSSLTDEKFKFMLEDALEFQEEQAKEANACINAKLASGGKLTSKELLYLKKTNPFLYSKAQMLHKKRENLERKLNNCTSKKEVEDVLHTEVGTIRKTDPDYKLKMNVINDAEKEFKKKDTYRRLPNVDQKKKDDKKSSRVHA